MLFCSCDRSRVKLKFYEKLWGGGGGGGGGIFVSWLSELTSNVIIEIMATN